MTATAAYTKKLTGPSNRKRARPAVALLRVDAIGIALRSDEREAAELLLPSRVLRDHSEARVDLPHVARRCEHVAERRV